MFGPQASLINRCNNDFLIRRWDDANMMENHGSDMFCTACGTLVYVDGRFCAHCGRPRDDVKPSQSIASSLTTSTGLSNDSLIDGPAVATRSAPMSSSGARKKNGVPDDITPTAFWWWVLVLVVLGLAETIYKFGQFTPSSLGSMAAPIIVALVFAAIKYSASKRGFRRTIIGTWIIFFALSIIVDVSEKVTAEGVPNKPASVSNMSVAEQWANCRGNADGVTKIAQERANGVPISVALAQLQADLHGVAPNHDQIAFVEAIYQDLASPNDEHQAIIDQCAKIIN
jgi:hypothetical protein